MSCFEVLLIILTGCYAFFTYWLVKASVKTPFVVIDKLKFYDEGDSLGGWTIYVSNQGDAVVVDLKVKVVMKEKKSEADEQDMVMVDLDFFEAEGSNYLAKQKEGKFYLSKKNYFISGDEAETPAMLEYEDSMRWGRYISIFNFIKLPSGDLVPTIKYTKKWRGPFKNIGYKKFINDNKLLKP
jgi:hypothetical protein